MPNYIKIPIENIKNSIGYIVSISILNKQSEFTIDDILTEVKNKLIEYDEEYLREYITNKLNDFIDNMIVFQYGTKFYRVNREE